MSDDPLRSPSDSDLDRLLASQPRRTTPEFEQRWRELRATFGHRPAPVRQLWRNVWVWPGLAAAIAAAVLFVTLRVRAPATASDFVAFEKLIALDATLARAMPLLEAENRDALLHLPAQPRL